MHVTYNKWILVGPSFFDFNFFINKISHANKWMRKKIPTCSNSALLKARNVSVQTDLQSRTLKDQGPGPSPKDLFSAQFPSSVVALRTYLLQDLKKKTFCTSVQTISY